MIGAILDRVDKYLGRGRHSIAVPVMDGPLHPNHRLDEATQIFAAHELDNLVTIDSDIWLSSGMSLMRVAQGATEPETVDIYDALITCLAASPDKALAVGLDGKGIVIRGGAHNGKKIDALGGAPLIGTTAAAFEDHDTLLITVGAKDRLQADWKRDLMASGKTGQVWRIDLQTGNGDKIADGLAYPYGVCPSPQGIVVSEAWAHRVILLSDGASPKLLLTELPGYPSRIVRGPEGGYALAIFAPRNQLVEFVLREPEFLEAMTQQVHPDNWIAPKLMWGQGFKEPMQGAALKTMGIIKPWAPTWSYGLVITLDEGFDPVASFHSRADGSRHGVTSLCALGDAVIAGSKGTGVAVTLTPTQAVEAH